MKKNLAKSAFFFLAALVVGLIQAEAQTAERPNIIFIFSDDHAYQMTGAYGNQLAKTPSIDRIAREGVLLENNLVTNSICGPSRATLLTGKYSHKNGYPRNDDTRFDTNQFLFPKLLQENGYQTAYIGKLHLNSLPAGFDYFNILPGQGHYYNPDFINQQGDTTRYTGYVSNLISDFSFDWLEKRDRSKPFFMVIGHKATHREWLPDIQDLGAYDDVTFPLPANFYDNYEGREAALKQDMSIEKTMTLKYDLKVDQDFSSGWLYSRLNSDQTNAINNYYSKVSKEFHSKKLEGKELTEWKYQRYMRDYLSTANGLDRNIGRVLDYLDKQGLAENTIVIYASDQGFYMGEHGWFDKRFIYEESLKTIFVARYPKQIPAGKRVDALTANIDWAPTILDMAGIKAPSDIQGQTFYPLLKSGKTGKIRDAVYYHYYEFPEPHHVYPHFGIRTPRYKLVKFYGGLDQWELYDLKSDPTEMKNLYPAQKDSKLVKGLKKQLKDLMLKYDDADALKKL